MPDLSTRVPADEVDASEAATTPTEPAADAAASTGVDASDDSEDDSQQPTDPLDEARRGRDEAKRRAREAEAEAEDLRQRLAELEATNTERDQSLERLRSDVHAMRETKVRERLLEHGILDEQADILLRAAEVSFEGDDFDEDATIAAVNKAVQAFQSVFERQRKTITIAGKAVPVLQLATWKKSHGGLPPARMRDESAI
jgi:predicted nuclease with TOPRIM domain